MNIGYTDYENFIFNTDWQSESRKTVAVSKADILKEIYELDEKFSQSQCENFDFNSDWELQSVPTEGVNKADILNRIYELDKEISSKALLPEHDVEFPLKTCQDSNTVDIIPCLSQTQIVFNNPPSVRTKEDAEVERQNHPSTWRADIENYRNDNPNLDPYRNTPESLCVVSVPTYDISFPVEVYQDVNLEDRVKSNKYNGEKNATKRSRIQSLSAEKESLKCSEEYKKRIRERNKEAARAYRKRKRMQDQELVEVLESLKKKKAMCEEELRFLKADRSLSAFYQSKIGAFS